MDDTTMKNIKHYDGREVRGLKFKAYPTPEQEAEIADLQRRLRRFWNWLVAQAENTRAANEAWAAKNGAGPRPARPANEAGEEAWIVYKLAMKAWRAEVRRVLEPMKKEEAFRYRNVQDFCEQFSEKQGYNLFRHVIEDEEQPPAHLLQSLLKAYDQALAGTRRGMAPPARKKRDEDVLIQTASGKCFFQKQAGRRLIGIHHASGKPMFSGPLDCEIKLPGITRIQCCMGSKRPLEDGVYHMEGVTLRREGDGWYASIRQHVIVQPPPKGVGACGIDVGLVHMFAVVGDDGATLLADNTRRGSRRGHLRTPGGYVELIAERQAAKLPVSKMHCRAARHTREYVRRELFPFTDRYEFVVVEDLPSDVGFRKTPHLSFMRTVRSMLVQRYGSERVIDVDPAGTSRTCSMCGESQSVSWSSLPQRTGKCPACGHTEHSDINAARNVLHKLTKSQAAE